LLFICVGEIKEVSLIEYQPRQLMVLLQIYMI